MPYCPDCGSEYRKGYEECADCGVELVEEDEDELFADDEEDHDDVLLADSQETELIEIFSGPPYAANMVVNALKDKGIIATTKGDIDSSIMPPTEASVFVTDEDYNEHDDIIEACLELVMAEADQGELFEETEK